MLRTSLEIIRKPADQQEFVVHRRRWVVDRTLAWPTTYRRRLARDYETQPATSQGIIRWAATAGMLGRLTRGAEHATRQQRRALNKSD
ncbi:transposase [Micromonospora rifamycinica]|uniref:Transposase DDE domain-containing protein n=1 Tax=Micromonospora rifamycinica TaxID=291594 RepID=A0A1C5IKS0_9ACTN|nr:transposase [Micromonospora rifamycinica]SCG58601.1 Transposase DDE domain-containing protein [Micromonospora rifamycinica]